MKRTAIIILAAAVICAVLLGGCKQAMVDSVDSTQQDEIMAMVFDAVENGDTEVLAQYMSQDYISGDDIQQMADSGSAYIEGTVTDYKKTGWYINKSLDNGVQTTTLDLSYNVMTDYDSYVVSTRFIQGANRWELIGFNVIRMKDFKANGAIFSFENFDVVQLLMLLLSAASLALMIIAIVACAKSKVRKKALWIVMIVLLHTGVSLAFSPAGFRFNFWILNVTLSSLQKYIDGTRVYNVLVPLGAILFLSLRRKLEWRAERHRMMEQYRQDYVPPYTPSEEPPEEVMPAASETMPPEPPEKPE